MSGKWFTLKVLLFLPYCRDSLGGAVSWDSKQPTRDFYFGIVFHIRHSPSTSYIAGYKSVQGERNVICDRINIQGIFF